jgi:hypothetical protein
LTQERFSSMLLVWAASQNQARITRGWGSSQD